ncbi:MAG TPA: prenyltransferase/squalene oxidase repeat-containing protein [Candidatus Binatia bacterium]|nr:prenyltransferase/squalene oxidase repeat-containing protein [Candidatus Binatia bacterium]
MKKLFTILILFGVIFFTTQTNAANLSQAVATLPQNEEWSIMSHASLNQNVGQSYLRSPLNGGSATDYEKRILAITSQGQNARTFASQNFISILLSKFDGNQMGDPTLVNDDIFGILALKSAGESGNVINKMRAFILSEQNSDGGWSFSTSGSSDSNTTAMAIAALRASGSVPGNAVVYLNSTQNSDGGYGYTPAMDSDGASTAWAIIGLRSAGQSVPPNAISFLESLQTSNGSFKWKPNDGNSSSLVTAYSVIALSGKTLPIRTVANNPPAPNPTPNPVPAPNPPPPAPVPAPIPVPPPALQPTPPPAPPNPNPVPTPSPVTITKPTSTTQTTHYVTISYPDNKIYVGNVSTADSRAISTLIIAAQQINLLYEIRNTSFGQFVHTVNGYAPSGSSGWLYAVNGNIPSVSAYDYNLQPGDRVQWFYGDGNTQPY